MERPMHLEGDRPVVPQRAASAALDARIGAPIVAAGATPFALTLAVPAPDPILAAVAVAAAGVIALLVTTRTLNLQAPGALRARSHRGCAWHGAADEVVVLAFLIGGMAALLDALAFASPPPATGMAYSGWPVLAGMLWAFGVIALKPVAEELMLRGALFAALRSRTSTAAAVTVAAIPSALWAAAQDLGPWLSPWGAAALGALAGVARVRYAALAPAIALHSGAAFVRCAVAALG